MGVYKGLKSNSDLQHHSRSLVIMPFDRTYMISYQSSIVTMSLIAFSALTLLIGGRKGIRLWLAWVKIVPLGD